MDPQDFLSDLRKIVYGDQAPAFDYECPICGILGAFPGLCGPCQTTPGMAKAICAWQAVLAHDAGGQVITYSMAQTWLDFRPSRGSYVEDCRAILTAACFN